MNSLLSNLCDLKSDMNFSSSIDRLVWRISLLIIWSELWTIVRQIVKFIYLVSMLTTREEEEEKKEGQQARD